ncbi:DUF2071 domain-containing protein [Haloarcula marina]|uniref:DUF2071 domain-containing protein n=1 Tax=Haloarcula marina TaxID=2961574 RepID=UPI0020B6AF51|nr:DUF2071 domain-containing protein [Halomicroarcula marina]
MYSVRPLSVTVADVCFCHWPVDAAALRERVPDWLTVERADGDAWLTAVAHTVRGVQTFGADLRRPAEAVNFRTYVRGPDGQRGVYFLALFSEDPLTSAVGGPTLRLPYREGVLSRRRDEGEFRTRRTLDVDGRRVLDLRYTPAYGETTTAPPDSLAAFLVERQRYYATGPLGDRLVGSIGHDPWPLAGVDADVTEALAAALSFPEPLGEPLVHYSPEAELGLAPPRPVWLD